MYSTLHSFTHSLSLSLFITKLTVTINTNNHLLSSSLSSLLLYNDDPTTTTTTCPPTQRRRRRPLLLHNNDDDPTTCPRTQRPRSLGGATGAVGFTSDAQAQAFADTIWDLFLGGASPDRPFGAAVLDGCVSVFEILSLDVELIFVSVVWFFILFFWLFMM